MEVKDPVLAALESTSVVINIHFTEVALAALEVTAAGGDPSSQRIAARLKANL